MKTLDQIIEIMKKDGGCFDGRDMRRLGGFIPTDRLAELGLELEPGCNHVPLEWTRENILALLKRDLEFAFDKALCKRGLSSSLMFDVIKMWNIILEEGLENYDSEDGYAMYGLPLYKATALKYGFDNPIGNDTGSETKYNECCDCE